ncbi:metal ABC transporter solute-binding protein, Zn/Mn family [Bordetella genomosp. 11]|uniref:ABC transporter substrate-binding protein n=1 Tax=Bordetella genomosp. 11 TaxID=1416808 RepID=A0A261US98_9BORD|nr:zinc ABC transporter substrate-binding protein [Bordetella genomosp. 11]OZI64427.1 ABC transporter substrate-binding protein [Bordetella genomosp. 11]
MIGKRVLRTAAGSAVIFFAAMNAAAAKTIDVVASFTVLADVVKHVGGDHVAVRSLVPPNGDPHDFEPSPADARRVGAAAVTFISGEGLETWFQRLAKAAGAKAPPVVVSQGIETHTFDEDGKRVIDPHVWNSIPNVLVWVGNIERALAKADPDDAPAFQRNADAYRARLRALDAAIRADLAAVPAERRKVLTSHDAFGYYGKTYGVQFLAPQGLSTETEASAADVAKLIEQINKEHVRVYFFENSNDPRLVEQIAKATGARPGGELYPEALSDSKGPVPTYEKLMRFNTDQIVKAISK